MIERYTKHLHEHIIKRFASNGQFVDSSFVEVFYLRETKEHWWSPWKMETETFHCYQLPKKYNVRIYNK